jgi:hypothetical protein
MEQAKSVIEHPLAPVPTGADTAANDRQQNSFLKYLGEKLAA